MPALNEPHKPLLSHSILEDAQAFVLGTSMCSFGMVMLTHLGLITGQTAGLAVLISYLSGWSFGTVFFIINLPFYVIAWLRLGMRFTIKSFIAVGLLSGISMVLPDYVQFTHLDPFVGALLIGSIVGLGMIVLFRHGASLGGVGVVALYLQDKTGFRAGWTQLGFDSILFGCAFFVLEPSMVAYSLLGAMVINLIIGVNHRRDRYVAT